MRVDTATRQKNRFTNLHEIEVVSWDVDGTLYAMPQMVHAMYYLYVQRLIERQFVQNLREIIMLREYRRRMERVRQRGGELDAMTAQTIKARNMAVEQRWYGRVLETIGPRAGVAEAIQRFGERGLRQIIVSDYVCDYKLRALRLEHCFERVFVGEEFGAIKPSPRLFASVASEIGVAPEKILHIGDRAETDGVGARQAGCKSFILRENAPIDFNF